MKVDPRQWIGWASGGALVAALLLWTFWPTPVPVDTARVLRAPLMVTLDEEGETRVRERFTVSAPVDGRLLRIELEPGDPVVAGETVLATFQPREATPLDARTRAEREAEVRALEDELERAKHQQASAQAELEFAENEWSRGRQLAREQIFSEDRLEAVELSAKRAREEFEATEHAVGGAAHLLASARARLLNSGDLGRSSGDPVSISAPIDGTLLRQYHESETIVAAGEPLLDVGDIEDLEIVADYLSRDAVQIRAGARALIESWGGEGSLEARVRRVEPSGFTKLSALGVEEQRVNVILDIVSLRPAREGLADGFRVEVRIIVWESEDTVQVATGSLFRQNPGWAVFVVEDGRARLRPLEIGMRTPAMCEVLDGLAVDDVVITHPSDEISDGLRVGARSTPY